MAEAIRAVPATTFQTPRFRKREKTEFAHWLAEASTLANDLYAPPVLSLEDEVFLGRMRARQAPVHEVPEKAPYPYAALPAMTGDGQYVFEFMRLPAPPMGARMDTLI